MKDIANHNQKNELTRANELPSAVDIEKAVIGSIIIDKNHDIAFELLNEDSFHTPSHKEIFKLMMELKTDNVGIDLLILSQKIRDQKLKVNHVDLINLTQSVASSAHLEYHCRILQQKQISRGLIQSSANIAKGAYEQQTDTFELLDTAFNNLNQISDLIVSNKMPDIDDLIEEIIDEGDKVYRGEVASGLQTPIKRLNTLLGGWRPSELIILAGRPGMGKTAFAIKCGWFLATQNIPVAFFSLEMSAKKLLSRCLSMETGINNDKFTKEGLSKSEQTQIRKTRNEYKDIPLYIEDQEPNLNINTLTLKAKKLKKEKGIQIIFVDYLQLMKGVDSKSGRNREQEISEISRGLKTLAQAMNIPVVCLSQLSRNLEHRNDKRPILSDLRESGAIEQDADVVGFFYRPEYYFIDNWDTDDYNHGSTYNEAEYIIAKNRNGGLGKNRMKFIKHLTDFRDIDEATADDDKITSSIDGVPF